MTKQQLGCYAALGMLLLSPLGSAQDGSVSTVLDRYNGISLPRQGPTIDASLAQRLFRRGNTFSSLGRYKEAIDEYRKAISADPSFSDAIRNLANTYYFLENYEETKPLLARYIELETRTTASLIAAVKTLGELERESRNYESAIEYDERAIELTPDDDSQVHIMANIYNNNDYPILQYASIKPASELCPTMLFLIGASVVCWNSLDGWKRHWQPIDRPRLRMLTPFLRRPGRKLRAPHRQTVN